MACFKEFTKYSSLNVLGMIALSCYILADTFFIAKALGANGLAALNLAIPIYSFIHGSGLMLGMGGATQYAIAKSQKDKNKANRIFTNTLLLALGFATVFFTLGLFVPGNIAILMGADNEIFQMSKTYLQVILLFAPLFILNNLLLCFVRNDGDPKLSMLGMLGGSFSNIILDYFFMFPLGMGIFGAVLATGLAPIISMLILAPFFSKKKHRFHLTKLTISRRVSGSVFSSGLPSFITEASSGIVIIVFNAIILRLMGNIGVAAYGIIANLSLVVMSIYTGIAQGIQPLLSRNYGAGNHMNAQATFRYALISMVIVSGVVYAIVLFGAPEIASIFNSEQNPLLQRVAIAGLKIYFMACLFAGFNIISSVYFTSTANPRPAHIISLLRGFLIIIPLAFLLASIGGMTGVWCVFPTSELIVSGIVLALFSKRRATKKQVVAIRDFRFD